MSKPKKETTAKKICKNVNKDIEPQVETLANAVLAMQDKINQQLPIYEKLPLAQQVTVGTGEKMLRANPAIQEFRATVRDYASALNSLKNIIEENKNDEKNGESLNDFRKKYKIIK